MFLVTGLPRSGTGYAASMLKAMGIDAGHETIGPAGCVSWLHTATGSVSWRGTIEPQAWDTVVHLVRHPLDVIASMATLRDESFEFMFAHIGHPGGERGLRWYMYAWMQWNRRIEALASACFRVEDLSHGPVLARFCKAIGHSEPKTVPPVSRRTNSRPHDSVTWQDLRAADAAMAGEIRGMARGYGYNLAPTVTVAMIVKNEEHNLIRCLTSIKALADDLVIVDTGSTDRSVAIAEKYGARVYHHPWQDDFAFHRNQSIGYATTDWVFCIDADEQLVGNAGLIRHRLEAAGAGVAAFDIMMHDIQGGQVLLRFAVAKLFRPGQVVYHDIKHNRAVYAGPADMMPWVHVNHFGYDQGDTVRDQKFERDERLLKKRLTIDAADWPAHFYLGQMYGCAGDMAKMQDHFLIYLAHREDITDFNYSVYTPLIQRLLAEGQTDEAHTWLDQALTDLPGDPDILYVLMTYGLAVQDGNLVYDAARRFIIAHDRYLADPALAGHRFLYFLNDETLAHALYHYSIMGLGDGLATLERLKNLMPDLSPDVAGHTATDLARELGRIGIKWIHHEPVEKITDDIQCGKIQAA